MKNPHQINYIAPTRDYVLSLRLGLEERELARLRAQISFMEFSLADRGRIGEDTETAISGQLSLALAALEEVRVLHPKDGSRIERLENLIASLHKELRFERASRWRETFDAFRSLAQLKDRYFGGR